MIWSKTDKTRLEVAGSPRVVEEVQRLYNSIGEYLTKKHEVLGSIPVAQRYMRMYAGFSNFTFPVPEISQWKISFACWVFVNVYISESTHGQIDIWESEQMCSVWFCLWRLRKIVKGQTLLLKRRHRMRALVQWRLEGKLVMLEVGWDRRMW